MWETPVLTISVIGRFSVARPDGTDITPRGRKTCGLLALLALAPRKSRTRAWLQDKLWSDRDAKQAAGSLRQSLSEIRQAFGADRGALLSDNTAVGIDPNALRVDIDDLPRALSAFAGMTETPDLLEGLDVRDEEFEDWLRTARQTFADQASMHRATRPAITEPERRPRPRLIMSTDPACPVGDDALAGFLAHRVVQGIAEAASVAVQPASAPAEGVQASTGVEGLEVRTAALRARRETALRVSLISEDGREVLWSVVRTVPETANHIIDHPAAQRLCNQAVDAAIDIMRRAGGPGAPMPTATHLALDAVRRIFTLRQVELKKAEGLLVRAQEIDPRGIYSAWRAFLRTIPLISERLPVTIGDLRAESEALVWEAIEREPNNSNVYALAAHVYYPALDNPDAALMLAERSLALNPGNPLAHAHLGGVSAHAGRGEEGYRHALAGLALAGNGPYRYQIMMDCCLTALMTGRYREAVRHGEGARALAPDFLPPIRYLAALYFHSGDVEKAAQLLQELRRHEPDFTVESLRDERYPAASLRRTPLIRLADSHGLIDIAGRGGMPRRDPIPASLQSDLAS
jgi:tetratricopeptide (TPR) repeat protein